MKLYDAEYQYHFQRRFYNDTWWDGTNYQDAVLCRDNHVFLSTYADKYVGLQIPIDISETILLPAKKLILLGKAMETHLAMEKKIQNGTYEIGSYRYHLSERIEAQVDYGDIFRLWKLRHLFLSGTRIWIQQFEPMHQNMATGIMFAEPNDSTYRKMDLE